MSEKRTPKQEAELLLQKILKGKEVYNTFGDMLDKQVELAGQPVSHWENKFRLHINLDSMTPGKLIEINIKLMKLFEEASQLYNRAAMAIQYIKTGSSATYHHRFAALVSEYREAGKKLPAAATLESLSKIETENLELGITVAEMEAKYFKGILDHLNTMRKLVENTTINISVEQKTLHNEKMLDNLVKKQTYGGYE